MVRLTRVLLLTAWVLVSGSILFAATGGSCPASIPSGITNCFYADYVNGSDANAGTSETAPLQHFPGMPGCASACSKITPAAGEGFVLRGGIAWPPASLPWAWNWSGTGTTSTPGCMGSGCIYVGVDPNWYSGSTWTRPILNAGGSSGIPNKTILNIGEPGNYLIFDDLEFTGFYWSGSPNYGTANISLPGGSPNIGMHNTIDHVYIHGWSHAAAASGTSDDACGIDGDTSDPNSNVGTIVEYSVIDGSDTDQASCNGAVFGSPPYIANNEMEYVASCMVIDGTTTVHDNICENVVNSFNTSTHENGLEINFGHDVTVYNNIIRHMSSGALTFWCAPDSTYTCYAFNNIFYDTATGNVLDPAASLITTTSGSWVFWNNTVECGPDSNPNAVCAGQSSKISRMTLQNNLFITNAGAYVGCGNGGCTSPTSTTNVMLTKSQATTDGYTSSEPYAFYPASKSEPTVGTGTSASSLCSASGVTACQQATTYAVVYNTTNHTVASTPALATVNWSSTPDIGAYQYPLMGTPQNLTGTVVKQ